MYSGVMVTLIHLAVLCHFDSHMLKSKLTGHFLCLLCKLLVSVKILHTFKQEVT
jgi:hypothetical protein